MNTPRLGVNIDHIATLRQLRGTPYPDLLESARLIEQSGGDQITVHLREDRRHIHDNDVKALRKALRVPLNLEMASTDEMLKFDLKVKPDSACLVPEKRQELTTEGGLALSKGKKKIAQVILKLKGAGIHVSLFIEPTLESVRLSHELGADSVELHTGRFCLATQVAKPNANKVASELRRVEKAALLGIKLGLHVHAGHGFDVKNIRPVVQLNLIEEYNIGHSIICRAAIVGLERSVREMASAIKAP